MKLGNLSADTLAQLVNVSSDIALVLNQDGVVEDVSVRKTELLALGCQAWIGQSWADTTTSESRAKVEAMIKPPKPGEDVRWRQVNHPSPQGTDVPVQYAVVSLGADGRVLALGRDMEAVSLLQRRLIETQQSIERDYLRLRHVEAKFRTLFETSAEAVMVVDASSYRVLDANANAQMFAKDSSKKLVGRDIYECFEPGAREDMQSLLRMAHATGRVEMCRARFVGAGLDCTVSASVFRQESGPQFLVRLLALDALPAGRSGAHPQNLFAEALEQSPDGFVLTDRSGRIQSANAEFLSMLGATALSQLYGQPLENWLLRGGVDWGVLLTNLRSQAMVKEFATELRQMAGSPMAVEISALALAGDETSYAFYVRDVVRRRAQETPAATGMAGSVAELSHLVGRMPMKDIVGETIDMIEKMCIQSALELTGNNRASAAEMLGLSRQSLYVKLRRFGMVSEIDPASLN
ncbi:transcriptional regulator PpsR [Rhodoferax lacus]|uniref:Transcriptional regulator PpsR n=1 Tax=Rhodoferax lacus TaxID=2184758 RepID=A0A3E1RCG1_9BURK|nr:transcriptional regulator PpsR [Rhodoferax lacus]RFO97056.1 transcriptional regulator PpsR [Rhodoferax lacus]